MRPARTAGVEQVAEAHHVDLECDIAVGRPSRVALAVPAAEVNDGHARGQSAGVLHIDRQQVRRDDGGVDHRRHGQRVVLSHRPAVRAAVLVAAQHVADHVGDLAAGGEQPWQVRAAHQRTMRDVEPDHRDRHTEVEHLRRGVRVVVDVELRRGGGVAQVALRTAAHDDEPLHLARRLRVLVDEQRDVGERPDRDDRDRFRAGLDEAHEQRERRLERARGLRQLVSAEAVVAVHVGCRVAVAAPQRSGCAAPDRALEPQQIGERGRVARRVLQADVARHRGDAEDLHLGARRGQHDGEGVVDARVCVDDDRTNHRSPSLRWMLGRGCARRQVTGRDSRATASVMSAQKRSRSSVIATSAFAGRPS